MFTEFNYRLIINNEHNALCEKIKKIQVLELSRTKTESM